MSKAVTTIDEIALNGTQEGKITVSVIDEPYGEESEKVVSIGIALQEASKEPDWKVHIPKANIDAVIQALQEAKKAL